MKKEVRINNEWESTGFEWEGEAKGCVAGSTIVKKKAERKRNYHIAMFTFDAVIAVVCMMTIVGIPFAMLFGYFAMKRYDKYLK